MRLIAYVRVSTEEQADQGHSLGQQPHRIAAWAEAHGHQIVRTVRDEGVSASVPLGQRHGGALLLRALMSGEADGVVAQRIDRLFRSARDGLAFVEDFAVRHDVALFALDGAIDTSTPGGWLLLAVQLVTAQYERLMDVKRAQETSRTLRQTGRVYGHVPFGCIDCGGGALRRDPETWGIRSKIVRWRTDGVSCNDTDEGISAYLQPNRPLSYRALRDLLAAKRIPSPTGGKWWSLSTLRTLCDTHADLLHLPMADVTPAAPVPSDTGVSSQCQA